MPHQREAVDIPCPISFSAFRKAYQSWHHHADCFQFIASNDSAAVLLAASCVLPLGLTAVSSVEPSSPTLPSSPSPIAFAKEAAADAAGSFSKQHGAASTALARENDEECEEEDGEDNQQPEDDVAAPVVSLYVFTPCCQLTVMLSNEEQLALCDIAPSFSVAAVMTSMDSRSLSRAEDRVASTPQQRQCRVLFALLRRSHCQGCPWRAPAPLPPTAGSALTSCAAVQLVLGSDSLDLSHSTLVRGHCAAVVLPLPPHVSQPSQRARFLLPRSFPPSVARQELTSMARALRGGAESGEAAPAPLLGRRWRYRGSNIADRILQLLFQPKRERCGASDESGSGAGGEINEEVVTQFACLLMALYGYSMDVDPSQSPPKSPRRIVEDTFTMSMDVEEQEAAELQKQSGPTRCIERREEREMSATNYLASLGKRLRCRYCAHLPPMRLLRELIKTVELPAEADLLDEEARSTSSAQSPPFPSPPVEERQPEVPADVAAGQVAEAADDGVECRGGSNTAGGLPSMQQGEWTLKDGCTSTSGEEVEEMVENEGNTEVDSSCSSQERLRRLYSVQATVKSTLIITFTRRPTASPSHCSCCPWNHLFLEQVIDSDALAAERYMDFYWMVDKDDFSSETENRGDADDNEEDVSPTSNFKTSSESLSNSFSKADSRIRDSSSEATDVASVSHEQIVVLRFVLSEVERLITCWRLSDEAEATRPAAYQDHPLWPTWRHAAALQPIHMEPDGGVVETYLKELETKALASVAASEHDALVDDGAASDFLLAPHGGALSSASTVAGLVMEVLRQKGWPVKLTPGAEDGQDTSTGKRLLNEGVQLLIGDPNRQRDQAEAPPVSLSDFLLAAQQHFALGDTGSGASCPPKETADMHYNRVMSRTLHVLYDAKYPVVRSCEAAMKQNEEEVDDTSRPSLLEVMPLRSEWPLASEAALQPQESDRVRNFLAAFQKSFMAEQDRHTAALKQPTPPLSKTASVDRRPATTPSAPPTSNTSAAVPVVTKPAKEPRSAPSKQTAPPAQRNAAPHGARKGPPSAQPAKSSFAPTSTYSKQPVFSSLPTNTQPPIPIAAYPMQNTTGGLVGDPLSYAHHGPSNVPLPPGGFPPSEWSGVPMTSVRPESSHAIFSSPYAMFSSPVPELSLQGPPFLPLSTPPAPFLPGTNNTAPGGSSSAPTGGVGSYGTIVYGPSQPMGGDGILGIGVTPLPSLGPVMGDGGMGSPNQPYYAAPARQRGGKSGRQGAGRSAGGGGNRWRGSGGGRGGGHRGGG